MHSVFFCYFAGDHLDLHVLTHACPPALSSYLRVFTGRNSTGVRGIKLAEGDEVISMSLLSHTAIAIETRDEYGRSVGAQRRLAGSDYEGRSEEHTSELQSLMRISYAVFCLTNKKYMLIMRQLH